MNQLHPPFNNPAIRRALLSAVVQSDFMRAVAGDDTALWHDGVGMFCPGSSSASRAGLDGRPVADLAHARQAIKDAGYANEPVVLLGVTDIASAKAASDVLADLLTRLGFNVDYLAMDWGTVVQRRTKRDAPDKGGWSVFCTFNSGLDQANPATHAWLSTAGDQAAPGWPNDPKLEALRVSWLSAPDPAQVAAEIQVEALQSVPYVPIGQYFSPTAFRRTLADVSKGFPVFWSVRRV